MVGTNFSNFSALSHKTIKTVALRQPQVGEGRQCAPVAAGSFRSEGANHFIPVPWFWKGFQFFFLTPLLFDQRRVRAAVTSMEIQALMLRRAYELGTLSGMKDHRAAPTAGKRRAREQGPILARRRLQEEYWRFYRTDDLILEAESYDVRAFCGGELVRHYRRVDKAGP